MEYAVPIERITMTGDGGGSMKRYTGHTWRVWDKDNPPAESEFSFVVFRNLVTGERWVQIVDGPFWYDNEPTHWLPRAAWPQVPEP